MRQAEVEPGVQRVPLVMVQQEESAIGHGEVGQAAGYRARPKGMRMGVGNVDLSPMEELWRTNADFLAV